jgi:hypothetical protein
MMPVITQNKIEFFIMPIPCTEANIQVFLQDPTNTVAGAAQQVFSG